ncbi:hypothetical protein EXU57_06145 [Segetibacter sp. 3557_3]|uniref:lipopolysaccharide biosynthesis protein n=1 Tax=Segetibacter sp. 3557_3 TaxID=2547429 RepID=UPI0010589297|nr:polysaccharide biosynthesis C-terminal domain-containing protein [Segetibacter sp. 3557_3]TDH28042.1 hypothetical protein EXU57_06145 [Segetibacter sp. 3557_3]
MSFQQQVIQGLIWRGMYFLTVLLINIFVSRYFEAENAGWIFYFCNNLSLLMLIAGLTMENAVNYYGSNGQINRNSLAWFSLIWSLVVSIIVGLFLVIYYTWIHTVTTEQRNDYLFYSLCYIAGIQLTSLFTVQFYSLKNFIVPNVLMILLNMLLILSIPKKQTIAQTGSGFSVDIYFAYFLATGVLLAGGFLVYNKSWQQVSLPTWPEYRKLFKYALPALGANLVFFLVYRVDYWFVEKFNSDAALGNYIQVSKLAQMLLIIPAIVSSVVFPHTASGSERSTIKDNILRIGRFTSVGYVVLFCLVLIAGKWLFPFVFGKTYDLMYVPFLFILPGIWALSNLTVLSAYFGGINKVSVNLKGAVLALVLILVLDVIFIPKHGIIAAAMISSAGYMVNFLYSFVHMRKEHGIAFKDYWTIKKGDIQWLRSLTQS